MRILEKRNVIRRDEDFGRFFDFYIFFFRKRRNILIGVFGRGSRVWLVVFLGVSCL